MVLEPDQQGQRQGLDAVCPEGRTVQRRLWGGAPGNALWLKAPLLSWTCPSVQTHKVPEPKPHICYRGLVPLSHLWAIWRLVWLLGCRHKGQALPEPGLCMNWLSSRQCVGRRPVLPAPRGPGVTGTALAVTSFTHLKGPTTLAPKRATLCSQSSSVLCLKVLSSQPEGTHSPSGKPALSSCPCPPFPGPLCQNPLGIW